MISLVGQRRIAPGASPPTRPAPSPAAAPATTCPAGATTHTGSGYIGPSCKAPRLMRLKRSSGERPAGASGQPAGRPQCPPRLRSPRHARTALRPGAQPDALNMFCQQMHLWMYVVPAADLHLTIECSARLAKRGWFPEMYSRCSLRRKSTLFQGTEAALFLEVLLSFIGWLK